MASPQYPKITVRLDPDLIDRLDKLGEEQGVSRSRVVRDLLADGLKDGPAGRVYEVSGVPARSWKSRVRQLEMQGLPSAAAQRIADQEFRGGRVS